MSNLKSEIGEPRNNSPSATVNRKDWRRIYRDEPVVPLAERASWQSIAAWRNVTSQQFNDYRWQERNSVRTFAKFAELLRHQLSPSFLRDVSLGLSQSDMIFCVSPYLLSLIDWAEPYRDPLRRQFIPAASEKENDHPYLMADSLNEREDECVPGLIHRYPDKVLLIALDACPVYCRFCTRSYLVGGDTMSLQKGRMPASSIRWDGALQYLRATPSIEDVVVSGGDLYRLKPDHIVSIVRSLLKIPSIRRIRLATKGLAVQPMKVLTHDDWLRAIAHVTQLGRELYKHVCIHTHFNHPREVTDITEKAMRKLFDLGIVVRNQSVLLRGVNDDSATISLLIKRLSYVNIQPYYVYLCDMVRNTEDMRTSLATAEILEKEIRGVTAGFNTPTFVVDTLGGGGKREIRSYEVYDRHVGLAVYTAPSVRPGQSFYFFDPLRCLPADVQRGWSVPSRAEEFKQRALAAVHRE